MPKIRPVKLVIDRSKWLTGYVLANSAEIGSSTLLDEPSGMMCCLGFAARKVGFKPQEIVNVAMPDSINNDRIETMSQRAFDFCSYDNKYPEGDVPGFNDIAELNDDSSLTNRQREKAIASSLAKHGFNVTFIGKYPNKRDLKKLDKDIRARNDY